MPPFIDLTGQPFGRLTVLSRAENNKFNQVCWECRCSCGNTIITEACHLKSGHTQSCGCFYKEKIAAGCATTHGLRQTPEYNSWSNMKARCHNQNDESFKNYGARGIKVCQEWRHDFLAFYEHIGPKPSKKLTIERVNNSKGYIPGNVIWADRKAQANNRRTSHNITINGRTKTIAQWADFVGLSQDIIYDRIQSGWNPQDAVLQKKIIHSKFITIDNVTRTNKQWSKLSGIHPSAIIKRLKRGWSPRDAVFQPVKSSKYNVIKP